MSKFRPRVREVSSTVTCMSGGRAARQRELKGMIKRQGDFGKRGFQTS